MYLFFIIYIACILYMAIPIIRLIIMDKLNKDTLFLLLTSYILLFSLSVFYGFYNNLYISVIIAFFLMILAFLVIRDFRNIFGKYQLLSIPYYLLTIYMFSYLLTNLAYL